MVKTALETGMISLGIDDSGLVTDDECIKAVEITLKDFAEKIENILKGELLLEIIVPESKYKYGLRLIKEIEKEINQLKKQEGI